MTCLIQCTLQLNQLRSTHVPLPPTFYVEVMDIREYTFTSTSCSTNTPSCTLHLWCCIDVLHHTLHPGQPRTTWNQNELFVMAANNSLWSLAAVPNRVSTSNQSAYMKPLVCEGITGGQWYQPNGALFPLATPDPVTTPGGLGQRNVSRGVELYRGTPSDFPHGVQCCTNTTITLCVGMYSDLLIAASSGIIGTTSYALSVAATCK